MFLCGKTLISSMTIGVFLCFTAVEFDDLQSFEWLVENQGAPLSPIVYNGLNALHCCMSLG
jgi:ABC-type polysaccharide/polyol phosphate export permease